MKKLMVIPFALVFAACAHGKGPMATATLDSTSGSTAKGTVHFQNAGEDGVEVVADLTGVPPGIHGFHVHEKGDCGNNATNVGGNTYEFPFDVVVKETGGHPVTIERVTANVFTAGGIQVASESYDAAKIQSLGFATAIQAKGEIHYHFAPRKDVADERLFSSVYGDVRVEGIDDNGTRTSTTTTITLKKR